MNPKTLCPKALVLALWLALCAVATAEPVITNLTAAQRQDDSGLVDIRYDVTGMETDTHIAVLVSPDNGQNYSVTPDIYYLSGDYGNDIADGTDKHIVWDAAKDQFNVNWAQCKVRLRCTANLRVFELPGPIPLEMVRIPAGSFEMGRYPGEQDSNSNEDPQHTVYIDSPFYLGKYELTKAQWTAIMGTRPWSGQREVLNNVASPAVWVSWNDAQSFVTALSTYLTETGQTTATFRLPSEAEWEYACRAGTTTRFYWGDDPDYSQIGDYAWWEGNAENAGEAYAHVVGQKLPNAWGLYDMSGNVWEWCQDDSHGDYTGAPTDGSAWGDGSGSNRVLRGGSWSYSADRCRSGHRYWSDPGYRNSFGGFRLALPTGP